jgi:hypothetical protein
LSLNHQEQQKESLKGKSIMKKERRFNPYQERENGDWQARQVHLG